MADHLVAAAAVIADAAVKRLQRETARRGAHHESMKAPAMTVDLDDVTDPYAF
jgi:hypothetical protein